MADKIKCSECEYCGKYYGSHGILPEVVSFAIILIRNILTSFLRITGCPVRRGLSVMALLGQMICL